MTEIPKIIHQIWMGIDEPLPECFRLFGETWKENHPGWKYELWDGERTNDFIHEFYPHYWNIFQNFQYDTQRLDAIRYLILDKMGGMYADFDTECLKPHDELLAGRTCCFSMEPESHRVHYNKNILFNNALMACIPKHPFMKKIVETVFSYIPKNEKHSDEQRIEEILTITGPFALIDIYESYPLKEQIFLIPAKYVSPYNILESKLIRQGYESTELDNRLKEACSIHYFWGNWWSFEK
jgi:mannosyltransferase OCH1-like enzyme